jgi:transcriptional regulator with XRE-family HTH domain
MPAYRHLDHDYAALKIGAHVRQTRKRKGLTLAQLADRLQISIGTLSAIENDKASISVDLLLSLSTTLNEPIESFLPTSDTAPFHITRRDHTVSQLPFPMKVVNRSTGSVMSYHNRLWPLARPFVQKLIEPFEIEVQSVPDRDLRFIAHSTEEFVFVLRGRIQCMIRTPDGLIETELAAGDCTYFWSYLPHCIRSIDSEPARTIHVEYTRNAVADVEYGTHGPGPTIYLIDGHENLTAQIAGKIVALRNATGMSSSHLAEQVGISLRVLKLVESAAKPLPIDLLLRICRVFQKPREHFLSNPRIERPFSFVMRSREIKRALGVSRRKSGAGCRCAGHATEIPLASGFPRHGMQPLIVRLARRPTATALAKHPGQECVYVLRGAVRFSTRVEGRILHETLLPGDACFLDASIPHAFSEMEYNAYERSGAEMLVIRCTTAPVEEREKRAGSLRPAAVSGTRPRHKRNGRAARAAGARRASRDRVI